MSNINKKIGIITYHRAINYGALLQVYALQRKIKEWVPECVVLDYRNKKLESKHKKKRLSDCKTLKDFIRDCLLLKNYNTKFDKFRKFADGYLDVSSPFYELSDLEEVEDEYVKFFTGSDQVWNYKINGMDAAYFLGFTKDKSKKKSYAASFGISSIPKEYKQKYTELLRDFNHILIREKQGADIIKELLSKESSVVLDPTLLISKEEWHDLVKNNYPVKKKKYILVYAFGRSKNIMGLAKSISRKTGYQVVCISTTYRKSIHVRYEKSVGPEEFLALFKKAEYIITNSFHGTAFAINFNKQFFTEFLPGSLDVNSRLENILQLFGLENRIIIRDTATTETPINYDAVNKILERERKRSIALLKNAVLGGAEK